MVLTLDRFVGKVAVVTGVSSGIGASIAEALVRSGIIVAGIARRVDKVEDLAKKLSGKKGKLYAVKADVSNEEELLKALDWVETNLGPIYILVNNAGFFPPSSLIDGSIEDYKAIFNLNVLALTIATREVVRQMREKKIEGHIVHINSNAGHYVPHFPGMGVYPASKHGVTALTETLRQELNYLKLKIKVTSVSPGGVATEMTTEGDDDRAKAIREMKAPLLRPEDIADGVVYVLSTPPHVQVHELHIKPVGELD